MWKGEYKGDISVAIETPEIESPPFHTQLATMFSLVGVWNGSMPTASGCSIIL